MALVLLNNHCFRVCFVLLQLTNHLKSNRKSPIYAMRLTFNLSPYELSIRYTEGRTQRVNRFTNLQGAHKNNKTNEPLPKGCPADVRTSWRQTQIRKKKRHFGKHCAAPTWMNYKHCRQTLYFTNNILSCKGDTGNVQRRTVRFLGESYNVAPDASGETPWS